MKKTLILFSLLCFLSISYSQNQLETLVVDGAVLDPDSEPLPFAALMVYENDSVMIKGLTTDENGLFETELPKGKYFIKIQYLSFSDYTTPVFDLTEKNVSLGQLKMETGDLVLQEIEITAQKSQMEFKLDKRVVNVGSDLANSSTNVSELLDNIPSVSLDIEGNVELRGSQNVRILIDGKPSGLLGNNVADALRQLQSSMVEKVEIITNPSARYDAEGEVGIINIVMKKESQKGFNGSINSRIGHPQDYGLGINFNLRRNWINFFLNSGIYYQKSPGEGGEYQEYYGANGLEIYESESERSRGGLSNKHQFGADFFLNDYNTITVSGIYRFADGKNRSEINYTDYDSNHEFIKSSRRIDMENEDGEDIETSISYVKTFDKKDRKFTADFKWLKNEDLELSDISEFDLQSSASPSLQNSRNREGEENFLFQVDYVDPIGEDGMFEAGLKSNIRDVNNDYLVEELIDNEWTALEDFDDNLIYLENIHAAYAIYGNKFSKISYQLGMRAEYSDITTELVKEELENNRSYLNFFPTAHFSYELNPENQFQVSYSRRLSRPWFRMLLPFSNFSDSRSRRVGNPDLDPEYSNSFETGYLRYFPNGSLLSSIYYRHRTGVISRISEVDTDGIEYEIPINLGNQHAYGVEMSFNYDFTKWWQSSINLNFYQADTDGQYEDQVFDFSTQTMQAQASSKFKLPANINMQASFRYGAPRETTQGRRDAIYSVDAGLSRDVLKGNGTLILSATDLLNSRKYSGYSEGDNFYNEEWGRRRVRQIILNFNYRINQNKSRKDEGLPREGGGGDDDFG